MEKEQFGCDLLGNRLSGRGLVLERLPRQSWFLRLSGKDLEWRRGRRACGTQGDGEQTVKYLEETSCWEGPEEEDQPVEGLEDPWEDFGPYVLHKDA